MVKGTPAHGHRYDPIIRLMVDGCQPAVPHVEGQRLVEEGRQGGTSTPSPGGRGRFCTLKLEPLGIEPDTGRALAIFHQPGKIGHLMPAFQLNGLRQCLASFGRVSRGTLAECQGVKQSGICGFFLTGRLQEIDGIQVTLLAGQRIPPGTEAGRTLPAVRDYPAFFFSPVRPSC